LETAEIERVATLPDGGGARSGSVWRIAGTGDPRASLRKQLGKRLRRDAWVFDRDQLAFLTSGASGDQKADVLVVRAHTRRGTNPLVRSTLADLRLYNKGDSYRGSSKDETFLESLALVAKLVRIVRPSDWKDDGGELMRNQTERKYQGAGVRGERFSWHSGEFMTIEKSPRQISVLWSTKLSLASLIARLNKDENVAPSTHVDFQTEDSASGARVPHEGTWSELLNFAGSGRDHLASVSVELANYEIWWGEASTARQELYPSIGLTFASPDITPVVQQYVETTGTTDVQARGRQALKSALGAG
jgi:hypothetical protein